MNMNKMAFKQHINNFYYQLFGLFIQNYPGPIVLKLPIVFFKMSACMTQDVVSHTEGAHLVTYNAGFIYHKAIYIGVLFKLADLAN